MSGSTNNGSTKTAHDISFETWTIAIAGIVLCALLYLLWLKERQVFAYPAALLMLAQYQLISFVTHSRLSAEWVHYINLVLNHPEHLKTVPATFFTIGFGNLSHTLWFLYFGVLLLLGFLFDKHSQATEEFTGQFHPTGMEYVKEWRLGRGEAPGWLSSFIDSHNNGIGKVIFLGIPLAKIVTRPDMPGVSVLQIFGTSVLTKQELRKRVGNSFIKYQSLVWENMKPIAVWDPFDCIPALDEVMRPEHWAFKHGIISEHARDEILARTQNWQQESPLHHNVNQARRVLEAQVTGAGRWKGVYHLPPYAKALAVICYFNRNKNQKGAIELAYACAEAAVPIWELRSNAGAEQISSARGQANEAIQKILNGQHNRQKLGRGPLLTQKMAKEVDDLLTGHWWRRTALVAMLGYSGPHMQWGNGLAPIMQPALLLWSQAFDRELYLALNCVGAETSHAEVAGIIAQYQAEFIYAKTTKAKIRSLERRLAIIRDGLTTHAKENNITVEQATNEHTRAEISQLRDQIGRERANLAREPDLNMNGPLNWLENLIRNDRNEAGETLFDV